MENNCELYRISRIEYNNKSDFLKKKQNETFLKKLHIGIKSFESLDEFLIKLAKKEGFDKKLITADFHHFGLNKDTGKYRRYYAEKLHDFILI